MRGYFPSDSNSCGAQNNALNLRLQHNWLNEVNRFCARGILCFWSRCAWRLSAPSLPPLLRVTVMDRWLTMQPFNNCNLLLDNITFSPTHCEQPLSPSFKDISVLLCRCVMNIRTTFPARKDPIWIGKSVCRHVFRQFAQQQSVNMHTHENTDWPSGRFYTEIKPKRKKKSISSFQKVMDLFHVCPVVERFTGANLTFVQTSETPLARFHGNVIPSRLCDWTKSIKQIFIECKWRQHQSQIKRSLEWWPPPPPTSLALKWKDATNHYINKSF